MIPLSLSGQEIDTHTQYRAIIMYQTLSTVMQLTHGIALTDSNIAIPTGLLCVHFHSRLWPQLIMKVF